MPVTNLVWLTSSSDKFTAENKTAMESAFDAQAGWVARNVPSAPQDREARGVALFQQVDDPRVVMETAHWSSSDEHNKWLASEEYQNSSAPLGAHFDFSQLEYFHLDVDVFRPVNTAAGEVSLLQSPVMGVGRVQVPADEKNDFVKAWNDGKTILEDFVKPRVVRSGFRVQKSDPDTDEFIFFVGWPSTEKHNEFANSPGFAQWATPLQANATGVSLRYYTRIL